MRRKPNIYRIPDHSREKELAGAPLASFLRRGIALLIDFFTAGITFVILAYIILQIPFINRLVLPDPDSSIDIRFYGNWYSVVWLVAYFTLMFYLTRGQSVGKKICRIRIVSLVHRRISLWHSFERALGYGASTLELGFGFIQYFIRPDRRTIHDRIAETLVILEPKRRRWKKGWLWTRRKKKLSGK